MVPKCSDPTPYLLSPLGQKGWCFMFSFIRFVVIGLCFWTLVFWAGGAFAASSPMIVLTTGEVVYGSVEAYLEDGYSLIGYSSYQITLAAPVDADEDALPDPDVDIDELMEVEDVIDLGSGWRDGMDDRG